MNGMSIMAVPGTFEIFALGLIILLAVTVDVVRTKVVNKYSE
jgi:ABC-type xylose transport system permease subunit